MTERINFILASGDGSFERPYIVKSVKDQYVLVVHFQNKIRMGDYIDRSKIWCSRHGRKISLDVSFMRSKLEKMPKDKLVHRKVKMPIVPCKSCNSRMGILNRLCEICYRYEKFARIFNKMFSACRDINEVQSTYRKESKKWHPDVIQGKRDRDFRESDDVKHDLSQEKRRPLAGLDKRFKRLEDTVKQYDEAPFRALKTAYNRALLEWQ